MNVESLKRSLALAPAKPNGSNGTRRRRIAVMTSGGDAPGMNGAVRAVVRMAIFRGCDAYAIFEGYDGLVAGGNMIRPMEWDDVRGFLSEGGTLIGTARCAEFRTREGRLKGARNLVDKGIDALVVCGGDGSLTGADTFRAEWPGLIAELLESGAVSREDATRYAHLTIVGMVGSIDNDMAGTDTTIGAYSSLHRICEMVDLIDSTAQSHQRAFVIEVMGRHCGWLALMAGISCGADFVLLPENPPPESWAADMCQIIHEHRQRGKRKTIVIVAEGAHDRRLNKITTQMVMDVLTTNLKLDTRITTLGHIQRGGSACAYDRLLSTIQGAEAVNAVLEATPETPSPVISIIENKIVRQDLVKCVKETQDVAAAISEHDFDRAMKLRSAEFREYLDAFKLTTSVRHPDMMIKDSLRLRVGIVHVGAPAGGMNAATRAAVAYCLARGHTPVAIYNGFPGLCRHHDDEPAGSVREMSWIDAEQLVSRGGSEIGTNRGLPSEDMDKVAYCFERYHIQALFVVGGFEAFTAVSELRLARAKFEAFKIPMVVLPATVSNNVPGTEYSLGSDTCLNALVQFCDACRQSASSSRRRVFVIETQGGRSGYIAAVAGICVGALAVYTPEEGISLDMIRDDIELLCDLFHKDRGQARAGKILLRNECASKTFTTQVIADLINDGGLERTAGREGKRRFEARVGIPGHFQQGTTPSPIDRIRATRFGILSMQHIETFAGKTPDEIAADESSVSVIGILEAKVGFSPMARLEAEGTDWKNRRQNAVWWENVKGMVGVLSGGGIPGSGAGRQHRRRGF